MPRTLTAAEVSTALTRGSYARPATTPARFKVGERVWLQARADAQARAGDAFDLKEFHRRALDLGPMGLAQLERELARV